MESEHQRCYIYTPPGAHEQERPSKRQRTNNPTTQQLLPERLGIFRSFWSHQEQRIQVLIKFWMTHWSCFINYSRRPLRKLIKLHRQILQALSRLTPTQAMHNHQPFQLDLLLPDQVLHLMVRSSIDLAAELKRLRIVLTRFLHPENVPI